MIVENLLARVSQLETELAVVRERLAALEDSHRSITSQAAKSTAPTPAPTVKTSAPTSSTAKTTVK